jgi:glycine cleavage system H protein
MKYTEEHEWLDQDGDIVTVGITSHAAEQLGDIVFVELPEVGAEVTKDDEIVVIESVKAASDILAPLDGEIVDVNEVPWPTTPSQGERGPRWATAWFFKHQAVGHRARWTTYMDEAAYRKDFID